MKSIASDAMEYVVFINLLRAVAREHVVSIPSVTLHQPHTEINRLPVEGIMYMIRENVRSLLYITHPTEQMKRLHELKWVL